MQIFWQLRWYFRQQWRRYGGAIVILILVSLFELLPPRAIGWIVDGVVTGEISLPVMLSWLAGI
ncbi:multidrug ABC transporter permease/ATP-binding protein, partial [Photobacterium sp. OFAV2-7]|nr:multidrug ABC transporter permease/ATP-binding protein [Photobacterium sp. OFAV2-7]